MIILDVKDRRAIYEQVIDKLSHLMLMGILKPEEKLPSVRTLATELSINPNTIQRAYIELEREGYIHSVKGVGSFVSDLKGLKELKKEETLKEIEAILHKTLSFIPKDELMGRIEKLYNEQGRGTRE